MKRAVVSGSFFLGVSDGSEFDGDLAFIAKSHQAIQHDLGVFHYS